jgi:hypothetical protein
MDPRSVDSAIPSSAFERKCRIAFAELTKRKVACTALSLAAEIDADQGPSVVVVLMVRLVITRVLPHGRGHGLVVKVDLYELRIKQVRVGIECLR